MGLTSLGGVSGSIVTRSITRREEAAPGLTSTANMQARAENAETYCTTPTPDGTGQANHPCVVYVPGGWHGYRYWMAMTPLAGGDSQVENPCILVSNDGDTWAVPPGGSNPVYPTPASGFNSDTELLLVDDRLILYFRSTTSVDQILVTASADGIAWATPTVVLTSTNTQPSYVSPSVVYDQDSGLFTMWAIDKGNNPNTLERFTSTTYNGTFANRTTCSGITAPMPAGREPWHIHVHKDGDELVMFYSDTPTGGSSAGSLWRAVSRDGVTWSADPYRVMNGNNSISGGTAKWDSGIYRTCAIPASVDGGKGYAIWHGAVGTSTTWHIGRTFAKLQPRDLVDPSVLLGARKVPPFTHGDLVDRADSAVAAGTMTSGQAWTTTTGTIGVSSGQLYSPNATNANAVTDLGYADMDVTVQTSVTGAPRWLVFRAGATAHTSFWQFGDGGSTNGGYTLRKYDGTTLTNLGTVAVSGANGDVLRVIAKGDRIRAYLNGVKLWDVRDSHNQTATRSGVQCDNTTVRFRNYAAKPAV